MLYRESGTGGILIGENLLNGLMSTSWKPLGEYVRRDLPL